MLKRTPTSAKAALEHSAQLREYDKEKDAIFGNTRTPMYFRGTKNNVPLLLEKNGWCLHYFNPRSFDCSDYVIFRKEDLDNAEYHDRLPVIEFRLKNHTLDFKQWMYGTILENIPTEVHDMIAEFQDQYKTTPIEIKATSYLKMYIAVLDEVPDYMVPTLVAHSTLGAHLSFNSDTAKYPVPEKYQSVIKEPLFNVVYMEWLTEFFRKCVVRVNRKEFEKITKLPTKIYLGHENKTLDGEKSCAVVYPMDSNDVPNVLKFAKLWSPA